MTRHKPAHLPEVDSLEITHYGVEIVPSEDGSVAQRIAKNTHLLAPEHLARRLAKLWRNLPQGSRAKCWSPAFRLRFLSAQTVLVDAEVCWSCCTIRILSGAEYYQLGFDSSASASKKLYSELIEAMAEPPAV